MSTHIPAGVPAYLAAAGAGLDARDRHGETPLTAAVVAQRLDIVRALLAAGADVDADNDVAATRGGRGRHNTPLMLAMQTGRLELVAALIAAGADVNARNDSFDTPLSFVRSHAVLLPAAGGMADALLALLDAGADPRVRHEEGFEDTALAYLAVQFPQLRARLMAAEAGGGADDCRQLDALVEAAERGDLARVRTLAAGVANLDARVHSGATALGAAARHGHPQVVAALLEAGAGASATDGWRRTPLMLAARNGSSCTGFGSLQVVSALIAAGADANARDRNGNTALMLDGVLCDWDPHITAALLRAGADAGARNHAGETALDRALRLGVPRLAALLQEWQADRSQCRDAEPDKAWALRGAVQAVRARPGVR